jgi:hypothetical protein
MKIAVHSFVVVKVVLILVFLMACSPIQAQGRRGSKEAKARQDQQLRELNKALLSDQQKQAELKRLLEQQADSLLQRNDTVAEYLANLDLLIDVRQQEHIEFPVRLMDDCRELIRTDLKELTQTGLRSGYPFKRIAAINDAYLKDIFTEYKRKYRGSSWMYRPGLSGRAVPEFGRADYLKAIRNIFTTIVTLRVNSLIENVNVVVYSMRENRFVANRAGTAELIVPLETGEYLVELSKPGYKRKVKKVVLGKYPKTITINEPLVMQ